MDQPQLARSVGPLGHVFVQGLKRGMVFWLGVNEDEIRGSEHFHPPEDPCPWVILSSNQIHCRLPIMIVAPMTSKDKDSEQLRKHNIRIPGRCFDNYNLPGTGGHSLKGHSVVLTSQLRVWAHERLGQEDPVARITGEGLAGIASGLEHVLDL